MDRPDLRQSLDAEGEDDTALDCAVVIVSAAVAVGYGVVALCVVLGAVALVVAWL